MQHNLVKEGEKQVELLIKYLPPRSEPYTLAL